MKKSSQYAAGALIPVLAALILLWPDPNKRITKPLSAFTAAGNQYGSRQRITNMTLPSSVTTGAAGTADVANKAWNLASNDGGGYPIYDGGASNKIRWQPSLSAWIFDTSSISSTSTNTATAAVAYYSNGGQTLASGPVGSFAVGGQGSAPAPAVTVTPVADTTAPVINGNPAVNAAGTQVAVNWTEAANPPVLQASGKGAAQGVTLSGFSGGAVTVTGSTTAGLVTTLALSRTIYSGETGGLLSIAAGSYTDSAATPNATAAVSNAAITNSSTTAAPIAPPAAPAAPGVSGVTAYGATLSIPALTAGATSYNLQYALDSAGAPGNYNTIASNVAPSSSVQISGLSASTGGYFRLVAVNSGGGTPGTSTGKVTTLLGTERGTLFQGLQIGVETTPGVIVPATKRLLSLQTDPELIIPVRTYRPYGSKSYTETQSGQEMTEFPISGILDFNTMPYLLASHIGNVPAAPVALAGGAYQWDFVLNETLPASPSTFTAEVGGAQGASKAGYVFIPDLEFTFSKEEASLSGKMMGQILLDNIVLTPNCPELPAVAMPPKLARISLGTASGSLTKLTRVISAKVTMNGHFAAAFFRDDGAPSYSNVVEKAPDYMFQIVNELGGDTDTLLSGLRGDTLFYIQVLVTGNLIGSGVFYLFSLTMPVKVQKQPTREDHDGVYGATYDFIGAHDPAFGAVQARVINKLSAL